MGEPSITWTRPSLARLAVTAKKGAKGRDRGDRGGAWDRGWSRTHRRRKSNQRGKEKKSEQGSLLSDHQKVWQSEEPDERSYGSEEVPGECQPGFCQRGGNPEWKERIHQRRRRGGQRGRGSEKSRNG